MLSYQSKCATWRCRNLERLIYSIDLFSVLLMS
jgi:hypothetical protein